MSSRWDLSPSKIRARGQHAWFGMTFKLSEQGQCFRKNVWDIYSGEYQPGCSTWQTPQSRCISCAAGCTHPTALVRSWWFESSTHLDNADLCWFQGRFETFLQAVVHQKPEPDIHGAWLIYHINIRNLGFSLYRLWQRTFFMPIPGCPQRQKHQTRPWFQSSMGITDNIIWNILVFTLSTQYLTHNGLFTTITCSVLISRTCTFGRNFT